MSSNISRSVSAVQELEIGTRFLDCQFDRCSVVRRLCQDWVVEQARLCSFRMKNPDP